MYYLLIYETVDNYIERRAPYRQEHLEYAAESHQKGELFLAGALDNPPDKAVLVFKSDSSSTAENFAKNDPYVKNGCIKNFEVRPWNVVIGG